MQSHAGQTLSLRRPPYKSVHHSKTMSRGCNDVFLLQLIIPFHPSSILIYPKHHFTSQRCSWDPFLWLGRFGVPGGGPVEASINN